MIDGEPRIVERDGRRQLVDDAGQPLVCRRRSPYAHGRFHKIDLDRFARDGAIRPRCEHVTGGNDEQWILRHYASLDPAWDGCQYVGCYGEQTAATGATGQQLATTLKDMSPEEFEVAVAEYRTSTSDGGEIV